MTCTMTTKDSPEAKRWLIVGAFQAGASEKKIARMVGLSKTAVRNIILNYKRTGDPSLPKRDSKKIKGKLLVEYDENGKLMMSDDEAEEEEEEEEEENIEPKVHSKKKQYKVQKHSPKIKKTITTKDLIEYMVEEVKRYDKEYSPVSTFMEETYQQQQQHRHIWCPTPPREGSIHEITHSSSNSNSVSPSYLPLSPPVSSNKSSRHGDTDDDELDDQQQQQQQQQQQKSPIALSLSSPSPPPSSINNLPAPSPYDQTIRGYEPWTHKEDLILMHHAMSHLQVGHWRELESRFEGRHTNRLCMERWNFLRTRLLKSIIQSITNEDQQQPEIKSSLINDEYRV